MNCYEFAEYKEYMEYIIDWHNRVSLGDLCENVNSLDSAHTDIAIWCE